MRIQRACCVAVLLGAVLATTSCEGLGDPSSSQTPAAPVANPSTWAPPQATPTTGTHQELCPRIGREGPARTVSLVLPDGFTDQRKAGGECQFTSDVDDAIYLTVGPRTTLATDREENVDPDVDTEGDDSVSDVEYDADTPVFGDRRGEALTYRAYNDGLPIDIHVVQADGVRLRWDTPAGKWEKYRAQFAAVTDSVGVLATSEDLCFDRRSGASARFELPSGVRAAEGYDGTCDLRLTPMPTLSHTASVVVAAEDDLTDVRRRVEGQRGVTDVRYDAQAPGFAGEPAERLDYLSGKGRRTLRIVLLQAGDLRLRWSAPSSVWPGDRQAFDQLRGSLRVDHDAG